MVSEIFFMKLNFDLLIMGIIPKMIQESILGRVKAPGFDAA